MIATFLALSQLTYSSSVAAVSCLGALLSGVALHLLELETDKEDVRKWSILFSEN